TLFTTDSITPFFLSSDAYGMALYKVIVSACNNVFGCATLDPGDYWLTLTGGSGYYWDTNHGPAQAKSNYYSGDIGSETFKIEGCATPTSGGASSPGN